MFRVSTDRQFQVGESIETQGRRADLLAQKEQIDVVRIFTEHFSASEGDRATLEEMFQFLKDNAEIEVLIVGDIDRFTRGGAQIYLELKRRLDNLGVQLLDATGIIQPEHNRLEHTGFGYGWSQESPSRPTEIFMAEKARTERSDILVRTIGQQIQLNQDGYHCRHAPIGYGIEKILTPEGKKKPYLIPLDPEAKWIRSIFELRAEGLKSDEEICHQLNAQGFRTRQTNIYEKVSRKIIGQGGQHPLSLKHLQRIVANPLYAGVKIEKWTHGKPIKLQGDPLVSISLFNRANRGKRILKVLGPDNFELRESESGYRSHRHNPEFLLRHVVRCPQCQKPLHASKSKGKGGNKFGYFHCRRHKPAFSKPQKEFEDTVAKCLEAISGKPGFLPLFKEVVREVWLKKNRQVEAQIEDIKAHRKTLEIKQATLIDKITATNSPVVAQRLEQQVEEIEATLTDLQTSTPRRRLESDEIAQYFELVKQAFEHPIEFVQKATTKAEIERAWSLIFAQAPTYQDLDVRTPDLTLIFRLNQDFDGDKNQMAGQLSLHMNTFETQVKSALEAYSS